ncbi:divalent metal cation transporter [Candidatus Gottesmanbacteria bacterium]|nr:divalent metal cation transporter [Candidatus Gottesmanbacteria bacterium]
MNYFRTLTRRLLVFLAVIGPGVITAFADNDAAGVATYSVAAARYGYSMLTILIPITIVLAVTQEIGGRIAIVSQKGFADLIRERFGIRVTMVMFLLLATVNFGVIVQDFTGLKAGFHLFGINPTIFLPAATILLFLFIVKASYHTIQRFFLVLIFFYLTYFFSAILAKPDWKLALTSLVIPTGTLSFGYLFTAIAVLGTTVTAWGQFFINSYVKDKNIPVENLRYSRWEIYIGAILTDLFSLFMMVAVTATIFVHQLPITDAAQAAISIRPFAGPNASALFGLGLIVAGFLGAIIVPLTTAYAFSEFFGFSGSLDEPFHKSKTFYLLFLIQIVAGLLVTMLPNISLFSITLAANFVNGAILPIIFYFLYSLANNRNLMGRYQNTRIQNVLLVGAGIIITIASLLGIIGQIMRW